MTTSHISKDTRKLQGEFAAHSRWRPQADATELRRALAASRLADYITRVVDSAPPLTNEQRDRLALLLRGGSNAAD